MCVHGTEGSGDTEEVKAYVRDARPKLNPESGKNVHFNLGWNQLELDFML